MEKTAISELCPQALQFLHWKLVARSQQQTWLEMLGDRACDFMHLNNPKPLEMKVGFALYGYPTEYQNDDHFYNTEQSDHIFKLCSKIQEVSKQMSSDGIYFSVIFVYCFIEAKESFWKKEEASEFIDVVFKINKGHLQSNKGKFIDSNLRVYDSWGNFKTNNKYPECKYLLPVDGKYQGNEYGRVMLELEQSPACSLLYRMGNVLDTGGMVMGLGGAVVGIASIFVPIAAPFLIGSVVAGGVGGVYSAGRSISTLKDRHTHQQSISLRNSEARAAWIELTLSAVTVGVSASSVYSSVRAASAVATAGGEAATSASNVAKGSQVAAKAGKGGRASARAAARAASKAANVGKGAKAVSTGSKAASAVNSSSKVGKAAANVDKGVKAVNSGTKMGKVASEIAKGSVDKAARASKVIRNVNHISKGASKAAHEVAKASKIVNNATDISKSAARTVSKAAEAFKTAKSVAQASKNTPNALDATVKVSKVVKSTANIGKNAAEVTDGATKVAHGATKAAMKTVDIRKIAGKTTHDSAKLNKVTSKVVLDASKSAIKITNGSAQTLKTVKNSADVNKGTAKIIKVAAATHQFATPANKVLADNIWGSNATTTAAAAAATEISAANISSSVTSSITSSEPALLMNSNAMLPNMSAGTFSALINFGFDVLIDITCKDDVSNVSSKYKNLLEEILILQEKYMADGLIQSKDIARFISYVNFYFNTYIINPSKFIDKFIHELFETAKKMYISNISISNGNNLISIKKAALHDSSSQISNVKTSTDGLEVITSVFAELQSAEIDWSKFDLSSLEVLSLSLSEYGGDLNVDPCPSIEEWWDTLADFPEVYSEDNVLETSPSCSEFYETKSQQNQIDLEDDWETMSEDED